MKITYLWDIQVEIAAEVL